MTVIISDVRPDDRRHTEGFARVRNRALPFVLYTPDSLAYDVTHAHPDAHYRPLLAEQDGEPIGTAQVGIAHDSAQPNQGYLNVYVDPGRARRGAGSLLVRAAEEHLAALGATKLFAWNLDEPGNRAFAESMRTTPAAPPTSSVSTGGRHPAAAPEPAAGRRTAQGLGLRRRPALPVRPGRGDHGGRTRRHPP